jgi:hypothetical protein
MRRRLMVVFTPYQPELHYMRGRGPKWREKHARPPADRPTRMVSSSSIVAR